MCPDYEAALKKEGGVPEGPVLESLLSGELLDKKVETKEEEPMSECQVRKKNYGLLALEWFCRHNTLSRLLNEEWFYTLCPEVHTKVHTKTLSPCVVFGTQNALPTTPFNIYFCFLLPSSSLSLSDFSVLLVSVFGSNTNPCRADTPPLADFLVNHKVCMFESIFLLL